MKKTKDNVSIAWTLHVAESAACASTDSSGRTG